MLAWRHLPKEPSRIPQDDPGLLLHSWSWTQRERLSPCRCTRFLGIHKVRNQDMDVEIFWYGMTFFVLWIGILFKEKVWDE